MSLMKKVGSGAGFGSGSESGSVSQWYGSADPNPDQDVQTIIKMKRKLFFFSSIWSNFASRVRMWPKQILILSSFGFTTLSSGQFIETNPLFKKLQTSGRRYPSLDEQDPDPHLSEKLDPDPHESDADPQPWWVCYATSKFIPVIVDLPWDHVKGVGTGTCFSILYAIWNKLHVGWYTNMQR